MKRLLLLAVPLIVLLSSCRKEVIVVPIDEGDWIYREKAVVVYSDYRCDWYVVETRNGYSVLRSWDGVLPYEGSVMYGDFSSWGVHQFYNRSEQYLTRADVKEYWLGYYDAMDEAQYRCGN